MVEPDPCPIDDDKLLTTNQAFALSCSFLDHPHPHQLQLPSLLSPASPPLFVLHMPAPGCASRTSRTSRIHIGPVRVSGRRETDGLPLSTTRSRRSFCPFLVLLSESVRHMLHYIDRAFFRALFRGIAGGGEDTRLFPVPVRRAPRIPG